MPPIISPKADWACHKEPDWAWVKRLLVNFISTRGQAPKASFADVLLAGWRRMAGYMPGAGRERRQPRFKGARYQDVAHGGVLRPASRGQFSDAELGRRIS